MQISNMILLYFIKKHRNFFEKKLFVNNYVLIYVNLTYIKFFKKTYREYKKFFQRKNTRVQEKSKKELVN